MLSVKNIRTITYSSVPFPFSVFLIPRACLLTRANHTTEGHALIPSWFILFSLARTAFLKFRPTRFSRSSPGHGVMNINRAFEIGGASLSEKTVEQLFNIRIHRVAVVDFAGFTKLIDAIGGITLNVEEEFNEKYNVHPPYQLVE